MKVPLITLLLLATLHSLHLAEGLDCSQPGWSSAESICFRIVHFQKDFWSAKQFCKLQRGLLLQLKYVNEVLDTLGQTMWGNAGEYRIDGWANGTWYQLDDEVLDPEEAAGHAAGAGDVVGSFTGKTLTLDLQTGAVAATADEDRRMGFICQGDGQPCGGEGDEDEAFEAGGSDPATDDGAAATEANNN